MNTAAIENVYQMKRSFQIIAQFHGINIWINEILFLGNIDWCAILLNVMNIRNWEMHRNVCMRLADIRILFVFEFWLAWNFCLRTAWNSFDGKFTWNSILPTHDQEINISLEFQTIFWVAHE